MKYCDNNCGTDLEYAPEGTTTCRGCRMMREWAGDAPAVAKSTPEPPKATPLRVGERIRYVTNDALEASRTYEVYAEPDGRLGWTCVDVDSPRFGHRGHLRPYIDYRHLWARVDGTPIDWDATFGQSKSEPERRPLKAGNMVASFRYGRVERGYEHHEAGGWTYGQYSGLYAQADQEADVWRHADGTLIDWEASGVKR